MAKVNTRALLRIHKVEYDLNGKDMIRLLKQLFIQRGPSVLNNFRYSVMLWLTKSL